MFCSRSVIKVVCNANVLKIAKISSQTIPIKPKTVEAEAIGFFDKADRNWDTAWKMKLTPWDLKGKINTVFVQALDSGFVRPTGDTMKGLIPGCGTGAELLYLSTVDFTKIVGLDISPTAIEHAKASLLKSLKGNQLAYDNTGIDFVCDDFFNLTNTTAKDQYNFIYDSLFFSAIDPSLRPAWAKVMSQLILPIHGTLVTNVYPLYKEDMGHEVNLLDGPPYTVTVEDYERVLEPLGFEVIHEHDLKEAELDSIKARAGRETLVYWQKTKMLDARSQNAPPRAWKKKERNVKEWWEDDE